MDDSRELIAMRRMSWQRAKGELRAFLETFWPEYDPHNGRPIHGAYDVSREVIEKCIKVVEDEL